ncbi:hypothetical protein [Arthrobacter burdickii]|uniref:Uncharacterized protein n=1 Tax=Arthrobacter burdickii TaxID=3035920 RepID=A0ABT8JWN6_9MICC|nr:hypothetical protein [Arthrobacter burdickii]MDN4609588.1 hypothetical protein [Arthrobacter burdickii]
MPKNTWLAAIALLLINAVGSLSFFLFSLPERSEWGDMTTGIICGIVAALLIINYRRTYKSEAHTQS